MAIEDDSALVAINTGSRVEGLNHIAELRSKLWGGSSEKDISRFMDDMREVTDAKYPENKRALSAILYLANIKSDRHELDFSELTTDERNALIRAMNHFRAVVSLFPKKLSLPN